MTKAEPQTGTERCFAVTVREWGELNGPPYYELVDGRLEEKPAVAFWHELFLFEFARVLGNFIHAQGLGRLVGATAKLRITEFTGRQPDLFFIPTALHHLVGRNLFRGVPPLAVEVLSPSNEDTDRTVKFAEYATLGIGQYWIVDCHEQRLEVYRLATTASGREYQLAEVVAGHAVFKPDLFPGLEIPLAEIWPTEFLDRTDD